MSDLEKKEYEVFDAPQVSIGEVSETSIDVSQALDLASPEEVNFIARLLGFDQRAEADFDDYDFKLLVYGVTHMSSDEARRIVEETVKTHADDRNFPVDLMEFMERSLSSDPKELVEEGVTMDFLLRCCAGIMHYSSPYPEVRSCIEFHDDPEEPCETFRAYVVATIWVAIFTFVAQFFAIRFPSIGLSGGLLQMFTVPSGMLMARILPKWGFTLWGTRFELNPGPWSPKEQNFVTVVFGEMGTAYCASQVLVQKLDMFYGEEWAGPGYQICMLLSSQFLGYGFAGLFRNVVVYPVQNMYYGELPSLALNKAFMKRDNNLPVNGWKITRWKFFAIFFTIFFFYEWLPMYLMSFLSYFSWICWIAPNNFNVAAVTGMQDGIGFNPIPSFDLVNIANLVSPVYATVNSYVGSVLGGLTIIGVYYTNMYNTAYLPINSNGIFDNQGQTYELRKVLTDGVLDRAKYQEYSPPFYAAASLVLYGAFFAIYTCVLVNTLLYDWQTVYDSYSQVVKSLFGKQKSIKDHDDPNCRMMSKYKETPHWWFLVVLLISLALALVTMKAWPTGSPVWALFMALAITIIFLIPCCILEARMNSSISTNVLVELIIGYAEPGHGVAMMLIKAFGVNSHLMATSYLSDLKFAHYAKIPPRTAFRGQIWSTLVSLFVCWGVLQFQLTGIKDICSPALIKTTKFICPGEHTYFSASVIWGVIGPKRIFNSEYPILKWCFLIGCCVPIPMFLVRRFIPRFRRAMMFVEPTIIITGFLNYAPGNLGYSTGALYCNLLFMGYIRRRYVKWFEKYNYVLSATIGAACSLAAFIIFFAVQYHPKDLDWWGNDVIGAGIDGTGAARLEIPDVGYFGRAPGTYAF